ncbi:MAG: hypothetical protein KIT73_07625, partial [Burkholderiales bacterium]|nr:hypothetical protein [Burkholderiales bacterium]
QANALAMAVTDKSGGSDVSIGVPSADTMPMGLLAVTLQGPGVVPLGGDFAVAIGMSAAVQSRAGQLTLGYDPKMLEPVGVKPISPGVVKLPFEGGAVPRGARFQVIGTAPGRTNVTVQDVEMIDSGGFALSVDLPAPVSVEVKP